jgi:hypothetical protein
MIVRFRFRYGPRIRRQGPKNKHLAMAFAALLGPGALMAYALGLWRFAADLGLTGEFAIRIGLFSHWQVWLAIAVLLHVSAVVLNRYGRRGAFLLPNSVLKSLPRFGPRAETR